MNGLIIKDIINLKKFIYQFIFICGIYTLIAFLTDIDPSIYIGIITMIGCTLLLSSISYDELSHWDTYALTMPISRDTLVKGKYVFLLLISVSFLTFSIILSLVAQSLKGTIMFLETLSIGFFILCIFLSIFSVLIPFIYKFGVEKSRIILFGIGALIAISIYVLSLLFSKLALTDNFSMSLQSMLLIATIITILTISISYIISIGIIRKKQY